MENWKDIKGYEGLYQVSNFGRVKSLRYGKEKVRKQTTTKTCKYNAIGLRKNNKRKTVLVHRLVAETFIPNPNKYSEVNHKDECGLRNKAEIRTNNQIRKWQ